MLPYKSFLSGGLKYFLIPNICYYYTHARNRSNNLIKFHQTINTSDLIGINFLSLRNKTINELYNMQIKNRNYVKRLLIDRKFKNKLDKLLNE